MTRVLCLFDHQGMRRGQGPVHRKDGDDGIGPYRVDHLIEMGFDLIPLPPSHGTLHRKISTVAEHRSGIPLDLAVRAIPRGRGVDVILAMLEPMAAAPALARRAGVWPYRRTPIHTVSCWWGEDLAHGNADVRARVVRTAREMNRIYVFSQNQVALFADAGIDPDKVVAVPFGTDLDVFPDTRPKQKQFDVIAVGLDRGRDFDSLVLAAHFIPDIRIDLFTRPEMISVPLPQNVTIHGLVDGATHRANLADSSLAVIPTHNFAYPTGQSVLLEAFASRTPAAITSTDAIQEYVDHGRTGFLLPLHEPEGIAAAIEDALGDDDRLASVGAAGRIEVERRFNNRHMWAHIARHLPQ